MLQKTQTPGRKMIKEMQGFLLSYNKNVIMFTVANQKAIAFHFHPDMFDLEQAMVLKELRAFHLENNNNNPI